MMFKGKIIVKFRHVSISLLSCVLLISCGKSQDTKEAQKVKKQPVRVEHKAHLSNNWYTHIPTQLSTEIDDNFALAQNHFYVEADPNAVRALIVPHAGHYYSGLCAATAYQTLLATKNLNSKDVKNKKITRVIILAPSHRTFFNGIALPDYTVYKTVLGDITVDDDALYNLSKNTLFKTVPEAHAQEHAIEIQLPFLQKSVEKFSLVPLIIGHLKDNELEEVGKTLKQIITDSTLVVISSDFMHHGPQFEYIVFKDTISNQVRFVDSLAVEAIANKSLRDFEKVLHDTGTTICGQNPIKVLIHLMQSGALGAVEPRLTSYYTSSHIAQALKQSANIAIPKLLSTVPDQDAQGSVSYVGMVFTNQQIATLKKENQLTGFEKQALLTMAREVVENSLKTDANKIPEHLLWPIISPGIQKATGAFVTLNTNEGKLRGCIGQISSNRPLYQTIQEMSKAAALKDTRFIPVTQQELKDLVFDITILSTPEKIASLYEIVLGTHGIILKKFEKDGTLKAEAVFLPQVPLSFGWDLRTTMMQLSIKAGLGEEGWKDGCEIQIFEGFMIKEENSTNG